MVVKFYNKKKIFIFRVNKSIWLSLSGYVLKIIELYKVLVCFCQKKIRINALNMDQVLIIAATFLIDVMFFEYN